MNQIKADPFQDLVQREERGLVKLYANRLSALRAKPDDAALEDEMAQMLLRRESLERTKQSVRTGKKTDPINLNGTVLFRETQDERDKSAVRLSKHQTVTEAYLRTLDAEYTKMTGQSFVAQYNPGLYEQLQRSAVLESSVQPPPVATPATAPVAKPVTVPTLTEVVAITPQRSEVEQARATIKPSAAPAQPDRVPTLREFVGTPAPLPAKPVVAPVVAAAPTPRQIATAPTLTEDVGHSPAPAKTSVITVEQPKPALFAALSKDLSKDFPSRLGGASRAYWETRHAEQVTTLQTLERQYGNEPAKLDAHLKAREIQLRIEANEAAKDGTVRMKDLNHKGGYYAYKVSKTPADKTELARQMYDYVGVVHQARNELADRHPGMKATQTAKTAADRAVETTEPMPLDVADAPRERGRLRSFFSNAIATGLDQVKGVLGNVRDMLHLGSPAANEPEATAVQARKKTGAHLDAA